MVARSARSWMARQYAPGVPPELLDAETDPSAITVEVALPGGRGYPVVVGEHVLSRLPALLPDGAGVAVVTQQGIGVQVDPGCERRDFLIGDGEAEKSLETIGRLCRGSPTGVSPEPTASSPSAAAW